jgi:RNA binding exosome subunit
VNDVERVQGPLDFSSISIAFLIHATEDAEELLRSVKEEFSLNNDDISLEKIEGYFGNEILSIKVHVIGPRSKSVADRIFSRLSKNSRQTLLSELDKSMDEHDSLYIRIDRQTLGSGELFLSDEEPIRVKVKPKRRVGGHQSMREQYRELIK